MRTGLFSEQATVDIVPVKLKIISRAQLLVESTGMTTVPIAQHLALISLADRQTLFNL
jgi:hypothetical protein